MTTETLEIKADDAAELARVRKAIGRELDRRGISHRWRKSTGEAADETPRAFDFSARVAVAAPRKAARAVRGKLGTILGRAPGPDGWTYTVFIDDQEECWSLAHAELKLISPPPAKPSAGTAGHIRVKVDNKGRGHAAS